MRKAHPRALLNLSTPASSFVLGTINTLLRPTYSLVSHPYPSSPVHIHLTHRHLYSTYTLSDTSIMASKLPTDKVSAANTLQAHFNETSFEAESRKAANFHEIEAQMPKRFTRADIGAVDKVTSTCYISSCSSPLLTIFHRLSRHQESLPPQGKALRSRSLASEQHCLSIEQW